MWLGGSPRQRVAVEAGRRLVGLLLLRPGALGLNLDSDALTCFRDGHALCSVNGRSRVCPG